MLSEEEKTTLEFIKINNKHKYCGKDDVDFLLNLIQKQLKEIEELQEVSISARAVNQIDKLQKEIRELKEKNKQLDFLYNDACKCLLNTVSKDKIKTKIEEIDKKYEISKDENGESPYYYPDFTINILQSLLEKE